MKVAWQKLSCVHRNVLIIISNTTGLSFLLKRIGLLVVTIVVIFYLLAFYLLIITKTHKYFTFSACSKTLLKSTCQHLLLPVGFDTLTYQKDYDRSPILVGHQRVLQVLPYQLWMGVSPTTGLAQNSFTKTSDSSRCNQPNSNLN